MVWIPPKASRGFWCRRRADPTPHVPIGCSAFHRHGNTNRCWQRGSGWIVWWSLASGSDRCSRGPYWPQTRLPIKPDSIYSREPRAGEPTLQKLSVYCFSFLFSPSVFSLPQSSFSWNRWMLLRLFVSVCLCVCVWEREWDSSIQLFQVREDLVLPGCLVWPCTRVN